MFEKHNMVINLYKPSPLPGKAAFQVGWPQTVSQTLTQTTRLSASDLKGRPRLKSPYARPAGRR